MVFRYRLLPLKILALGNHTLSNLNILLMEEILHHLGCIRSPVNNKINYLSTGAGFRPSTVALKIDPWKRRFLLETIIFRFHISFRECHWLVVEQTQLQNMRKLDHLPRVQGENKTCFKPIHSPIGSMYGICTYIISQM